MNMPTLCGAGLDAHQGGGDGLTARPDQELEHAHHLAQAALRIEPANQLAHILLALVYSYQQNYDLALDELDRATEAEPQCRNHAERGWVLLVGGRSGEAVTALEEALRLDPSPTPNTFSNLAIAYYLQGRHDEAIATAQSGVGRYLTMSRSISHSLRPMPKPGSWMRRRAPRMSCGGCTLL